VARKRKAQISHWSALCEETLEILARIARRRGQTKDPPPDLPTSPEAPDPHGPCSSTPFD